MGDIIRLEPFSMAIFHKVDSSPGFAVKLCTDASLFAAVHSALFVGPPDDDTREEAQDIVDDLRTTPDIEFEDGWISLRIGMSEVTQFLLGKVGEAKDEEQYADKRRFEELKARQAAEERYAILRQALVDALGASATLIAARAAS